MGLEKAALVGVLQRASVFPLPWLPAGISGVIETEFGVIPLVSMTGQSQTPAIEANRLVAVVQTAKGLMAVDVESIEEADETLAAVAVSLVDSLEEMAAALIAGQISRLDLLDSRLGPQRKLQTFAHVRSGTAHFAIPAQDIVRLERHEGIHPAGSGHANEWIVQIGDELHSAASLSHEAAGGQVADEPWCMLFAEPARFRGLLVEEVIELLQVDTAQVKKVPGVHGDSVWLTRPELPPLKVLLAQDNPDCGNAQLGHESSSQKLAAHGAAPKNIRSENTVVGLQVSGYRWLLPLSAVEQMIGRLDAEHLRETRLPNHLPVIDLARGFNPHAAIPGIFAVILKIGRLKFVGLVDRVAILQRTANNRGCPALPASLAGCVEDIGVLDGELEIRLKERISQRQLKSIFSSMPKDAFVGWLARSY